MRAELLRADRQTDRCAEAFRNFAKARQVLTEVFWLIWVALDEVAATNST